MSDLIDRQVALNALKEHRALYCDNTPDTFSKLSYAEKSRVDELDTAIATIINLPSVEPKKGEWTDGDNICPKCGEDKFKGLEADIYADWQPNFCPNCGADMRKPAKGD